MITDVSEFADIFTNPGSLQRKHSKKELKKAMIRALSEGKNIYNHKLN